MWRYTKWLWTTARSNGFLDKEREVARFIVHQEKEELQNREHLLKTLAPGTRSHSLQLPTSTSKEALCFIWSHSHHCYERPWHKPVTNHWQLRHSRCIWYPEWSFRLTSFTQLHSNVTPTNRNSLTTVNSISSPWFIFFMVLLSLPTVFYYICILLHIPYLSP